MTLNNRFYLVTREGFLRKNIDLVVRALERYSKDPGSSPGGDACFSH